MFGVRSAMEHYLHVVSPWCTKEWSQSILDSEEFGRENTDPDRMVFQIPTRPMPGFFEQWLLGQGRSLTLMNLLGWIDRFNDAAVRYNFSDADNAAQRIGLAKSLHGVIGVRGGNTLFDAFTQAEEAL